MPPADPPARAASGAPAAPSAERLFLALWPPAAVREQLAAAASALHRRCNGRIVASASLHLTLHFLGAVPIAERARIEHAAGRVTPPGFALRIDRLGLWPAAGIGWAAPSVVPDGLSALHAALGAAVDGGGRAPAGRRRDRRFTPHVTLLRAASPARPARRSGDPPPAVAGSGRHRWPLDPPIDWTVRDVVLVHSRLDPAGARYEVLRRWPLAAPPES